MKRPDSTKSVVISWFIFWFIIAFLFGFFNQPLLLDIVYSFIRASIVSFIAYFVHEWKWKRYLAQFPDGIIPAIEEPPIKYTSSRSAIILAVVVALLVLVTSIYLIYF